MKLLSIIIFNLIGLSMFCQEITINDTDKIKIPFSLVETPPLYPECDAAANVAVKRKCMTNKISEFVNANFNKKLGYKLNLAGKQRIFSQFTIDAEGHVTNIMARGPRPELEFEAIRVIKQLPQFEPASAKGKHVAVVYALPIVFFAPKLITDNETFKRYYKTGELKQEGHIKKRKQDGQWKSYYKSGGLASIKNYSKGKLDFKGISYRKDGSISSEKYIKNNKKHTKKYYKTGELFLKIEMSKVNEGFKNDYYKNGNLKIERPYKDKELEGVCKFYYETGEKEWEINYTESYKQGNYKQYYKNGNLKLEGNHENDLKVGTENHYYEDGSLKLKGQYNKNTAIGKWMLLDNNGKKVNEFQTYKGAIKAPDSLNIKPSVLPEGLYSTIPIHPECKNLLGHKKTRMCTAENISKLIQESVKIAPSKIENKDHSVKMTIDLEIDQNGYVSKVRPRTKFKLLKEDIIRVLKQLPKMEPQKLRGTPVKGHFLTPATYLIK